MRTASMGLAAAGVDGHVTKRPKRKALWLLLVVWTWAVFGHGVAAANTSLVRADSGSREDADLQLIPGELMTPASPRPEAETGIGAVEPAIGPEGPETYRLKVFLDDAFQVNFKRGSLVVPLPQPRTKDWSNRFSVDGRFEAELAPGVSFTVADRVNVFLDESVDLSQDGFLNDLKEAYLTWNCGGSYYWDLGRVNIKDGVAVGFNPTDYFKKNAVTTRISEDPSVLRENRLGTFVVRGQGIWDRAALTMLVAPAVSDEPDRWWTDDTGGFGLERTNDRTRFLAKGSLKGGWELNPELLYYYEDGRSNVGLNLSRALGDQLVAYAEWSIGQRADLIAEGLQRARSAGIVPRNQPPVLAGSREDRFRNQLAVGLSYTETVKRTTYFEYHFNEAGFSEDDWTQWFHRGAQARQLRDDPTTVRAAQGMLAQLWSIRQFAQDAQEPLNQHGFLIKTLWQEAFFKKLDLEGLFLINPNDGSFFLQPLVEYHFRPNVTLSLTVNLFLGSDHSEFGSLEQLGNIRLGATYYF